MPVAFRIAVLIAACGCLLFSASADEPVENGRARVEFRWLESAPIEGVTTAEGIQTTCGDELSYPHLEPILTNDDVARAELKEYDFSASGLPGPQFSVSLHLTEAARQTLIESRGDAPDGMLAIFVDDRYWGTGYFQADEADKFVPFAGFLTSRAEAERIVDACE